jgi:hypothetical protein
MSSDDPRLQTIRNTVQTANSFLAPYANGQDEEARLRNLEEIMKRAARFGFVLFSQPASFRFDWTDTGAGVVAFPTLVQVTDEYGKSVGRVFAEKELVAV